VNFSIQTKRGNKATTVRPGGAAHWSLAVVLIGMTLVLSCTYFVRSDYVPDAARGQVATDGWQITPRIRSNVSAQQTLAPPPPDRFVISFVASRPLPRGDQSRTMVDIRLDSARISFRPGDSSLMCRINEGAFISYREISPDSIVKRFSIVQSDSHLMVWHRFPTGTKELAIDLFVTSDSGSYVTRRDSASGVQFDSILPLEAQGHPKALTSIVIRRDRLTSSIGWLQNEQ
jgi:hypothetical protein